MTPTEVLLPEPAVGKYTGTNNQQPTLRSVPADIVEERPCLPESGQGSFSSLTAHRLPILARDAE